MRILDEISDKSLEKDIQTIIANGKMLAYLGVESNKPAFYIYQGKIMNTMPES